MSEVRLSVVIPAHNEAAIIGANLTALIADGAADHLDVVVVANGCTDRTAEVAASVSPKIRVIELAQGSKIAALNAGDMAATAFPVAFVDADVRVSGWSLLDVAAALVADDKMLIGSPRMIVDTTRSTWLVRQHYRIWELTDFRKDAHVGSGIYMLTEQGRSRFGRFPDVIADDLFVLRLFHSDERLSLRDRTFSVHAPATYRAHLRRTARIAAGNRQLADFGLSGEVSRGNMKRLVRRVIRRPALWPAFIVYVVGYAAPRVRRGRSRPISWNRDDTTRVTL